MHEDGPRPADWYFDVISPFAYFAWQRLPEVASRVRVHPRPVLFAAMLDHWGQKGPAEIAPKRAWTYRYCAWYARRHDITFRPPAAHPFNPLPWLRLIAASGNATQAIDMAFRAVWTSGNDAADPVLATEAARQLGIDPARLADDDIKQAVRRNTEDAVAAGVFGVPTMVLDGSLFWGVDGFDLLLDYLDHPGLFDEAAMRRAAAVPLGQTRRGAG